ncbi:MAG: HAD family hydrolase [Sediminibacterium sp.]|jgi:histidinol-phosphate phosphatase family protein|nr:HAD family hydrolase [Sediminibacterium sp.]
MNYPNWDLPKIDNSWTLFLDRDGVINYEKKDDYIRNKNEFRFYEGVPEAIGSLSAVFGKVFIVTNQRGIGKGWMTEDDLIGIHQYMCQEIQFLGGRIDQIYYCTAISNDDPCRKPNPGMAFQAKKDFPSIDFSKSIMVGNKPSDMRFGRNAGMHTVYVATTHPDTPFPHPDIDGRWNSLPEFAKALMKS